MIPVVDLITIEAGLQVVQLVRIGFFAENRGSIVRFERRSDAPGIVHEVQHESVVLPRTRTVQSRDRLNRLDAREHLVHVLMVCKSGSS